MIRLGDCSQMKTGSRSTSQSSNKLHSREVMLIRQLLVWGWSEERIWKDYRIPLTVIEKAKKEIERQALEDFENKGQQAFELGKLKDRLKFVIDSADSITKDENLSRADRIKFETIKLDAIAVLGDAIE